MSPLLSHIWFLVRELLRVPFDVVFRIRRRTYALAADVRAPKETVWAIASAHQITLEGNPPIKIDTLPDPERPGHYCGTVTYPGRAFKLAYRVLEERPGEALLMTVVPEESSPECCPGEDYVSAVAIAGNANISTLSLTQQITHTHFRSRLLVPLAVSQNLRRIAHNAEMRTGTAERGLEQQIKEAAITGALTFASFFAMFGWEMAAMLLLLILIHEFGHVVAMRWVGIPVKGIYFVPFFGGVAVGADRYRNEGERGLVALMGPGFSLATTMLFVSFAMRDDSASANQMAFMSAILNGLNLMPILPLDGGHVLQALLSRFGQGVARSIHVLTLMAGEVFAISTRRYVLAMLLMLILPALLSRTAPALRPLTRAQWGLLVIAYLGTCFFYAAVVLSFGESGPDTAGGSGT